MGVNREAANREDKCFHRAGPPPAQLPGKEVKRDPAKVKFGIEARGRKNKLHNSISYCHLEDLPPELQQPQSLSRSALSLYLSALPDRGREHMLPP